VTSPHATDDLDTSFGGYGALEDGLIDDSVLQKQEEALAALDRDPFKDYKFPCSYCDKKFPTDFILDYHLKLVHKGNCYITYQYLTISYITLSM
jgi:hypothetical protein